MVPVRPGKPFNSVWVENRSPESFGATTTELKLAESWGRAVNGVRGFESADRGVLNFLVLRVKYDEGIS